MNILLLFSFLLLGVCSADNGIGHNPHLDGVVGYNRTILLFTTATVPAGQLLPVQDLTTIIDPGWIRQKNVLGFYTDAQSALLKSSAFDFFNIVWGRNFNLGFQIPAYGAYCLPTICVFPYTRIGSSRFPINYDSKNPERSGLWVLHQVGWIAVNYVFTPTNSCTPAIGVGYYAGLKNLSMGFPGDLIEYGELNFAHPDLGVNKTYTDPTSSNHREVIRVRAIYTSRQTSNGEGALDTLGKLQAAQMGADGTYPNWDEVSDNNGYESSAVHRAKQPDGATTFYGRASWVWSGRGEFIEDNRNKNNKKRDFSDDFAALTSNLRQFPFGLPQP